MFIHTVLMRFHAGTSDEFHAEVGEYAARVRAECDGVQSYVYAPNEAERSGGFTHAVVGCFDDEAAHERYQVSPVHVAMKTFMATRIASLVVFDSAAMP
jgi:quinol monooxygenase YgiN